VRSRRTPAAGPHESSTEKAARAYLNTVRPDLVTVDTEMVSVQGDLLQAKQNPNQSGLPDQMAQDAQKAHDGINNIRDDFATAGSDDDSNLGNAEADLYVATNDLKIRWGRLWPTPGTQIRPRWLSSRPRTRTR